MWCGHQLDKRECPHVFTIYNRDSPQLLFHVQTCMDINCLCSDAVNKGLYNCFECGLSLQPDASLMSSAQSSLTRTYPSLLPHALAPPTNVGPVGGRRGTGAFVPSPIGSGEFSGSPRSSRIRAVFSSFAYLGWINNALQYMGEFQSHGGSGEGTHSASASTLPSMSSIVPATLALRPFCSRRRVLITRN